jgi:hypothetical protein
MTPVSSTSTSPTPQHSAIASQNVEPIIPDFPALRRQLASSDYAQRESAQQILNLLPPSTHEALRTWAKTESDPEVKARLNKAADILELQAWIRPRGLTLHVKDARLPDILAQLAKQLGPNVKLSISNLADARFSIDADDVSFWHIFMQLNHQSPLDFQTFNWLSPTSSTVELQFYTPQRPRNYTVADNFLINSFAQRLPDGTVEVRLAVNADPRVRVFDFAYHFKLISITDQDGNHLARTVYDNPDHRWRFSCPDPHFDTGASFSPLPGTTSIKEIHASVDLTILNKETTLNVETPDIRREIKFAQGTLTLVPNGQHLDAYYVSDTNPDPNATAPVAASYFAYRTFNQLDKYFLSDVTSLKHIGISLSPADKPATIQFAWPESSRPHTLPIEIHDLSIVPTPAKP